MVHCFYEAAMDFFHFNSFAPVPDKLYEESLAISFPKSADISDRLYFEKLLLQPVQINLSFSKIQRSKTDVTRYK
jgi:hypothetical protein